MAAKVGAALGEDQAGALRIVVEGEEDGRVGGAMGIKGLGLLGGEQDGAEVLRVAQIITCTVPPSTLQAAPAT
jgi:hypothetical protein